MKLKKLQASFGGLQNETLVLEDGLNILQAPNETGKSTWCAFLLSMLYGVNTKERDRAGVLADKNRYAPWDGGSMSGRLDCRAGDDALTLFRTTRRQTAPMGDFQALYTGTADLVPGLTGANCGETLLGVSREVYERSAFIGQSGMALTSAPDLEKRIAALASSPEESVSYSQAEARLREWLNRRRVNIVDGHKFGFVRGDVHRNLGPDFINLVGITIDGDNNTDLTHVRNQSIVNVGVDMVTINFCNTTQVHVFTNRCDCCGNVVLDRGQCRVKVTF